MPRRNLSVRKLSKQNILKVNSINILTLSKLSPRSESGCKTTDLKIAFQTIKESILVKKSKAVEPQKQGSNLHS